MTPLDLTPFLITPGNRVIARKVESERARQSYIKRRREQIAGDVLFRQMRGVRP